MITIIYAHPWDKSFNHAILDAVVDKLATTNREYQVIDLYADKFNPVITADDLRLYSHGESPDQLVDKYIAMLQNSDMVIMIAPVWWGMVPAIVCGFFDKVFLKGKAYNINNEGVMTPALDISRTIMVTTSQNPTVMSAEFYRGYLEPMILNTVGMSGVEWYNCDAVKTKTNAERNRFISDLTDRL